MKELYTNKCVLSTFDVAKGVYHRIAANVKSYGVDIEYSESDGEGRIIIAKSEVDEVALQRALKYIYGEIGDRIYYDEDKSLAERAVELLNQKGLMLAVAESCTGGMICSRICDIEGASAVFYEGLITYNSGSKVRKLHVPASIIDKHSAVSSVVCGAMLQGVLANKEVSIALATTGYASGMGEMDGLVYVGIADRETSEIIEFKLDGSRNEIRRTATNNALFMLINKLGNDYSI